VADHGIRIASDSVGIKRNKDGKTVCSKRRKWISAATTKSIAARCKLAKKANCEKT
jgi:hypothetical protein